MSIVWWIVIAAVVDFLLGEVVGHYRAARESGKQESGEFSYVGYEQYKTVRDLVNEHRIRPIRERTVKTMGTVTGALDEIEEWTDFLDRIKKRLVYR